MHGLQACLCKYITVAAFHIYLSVVKMPVKGEVGGHALKSHGNYIVDHGKIMELCFWISVGTLLKSPWNWNLPEKHCKFTLRPWKVHEFYYFL